MSSNITKLPIKSKTAWGRIVICRQYLTSVELLAHNVIIPYLKRSRHPLHKCLLILLFSLCHISSLSLLASLVVVFCGSWIWPAGQLEPEALHRSYSHRRLAQTDMPFFSFVIFWGSRVYLSFQCIGYSCGLGFSFRFYTLKAFLLLLHAGQQFTLKCVLNHNLT